MELYTLSYTQEQGWSDTFPSIDSPNTLIILFGAPEYRDAQQPIQELMDAYPQAKIIGCSTAGEIEGTKIIDNSLSVAVMKFKTTTINLAATEIKTADDSYKAGQRIAEELNGENLRAIFILSDGLNVNGSQLVNGLNSVLSDKVIVTGGLAGDGNRFKQTWVIAGKKLRTHFIAAISFSGDKIRIGHGSKGGWDSFGPERLITRAKDNILYELDNKPVLPLYKEYLGELAKDLPASGLLFPLAIRKTDKDTKEIVRTILKVDEENQALIFAGDMPIGYKAKLMRANFDRLVTGANEAALFAKGKSKSVLPSLAVAISCVGRRMLLGEYSEEETQATLDSLSKEIKQIGFYSYGEISPYTTGYCDLHNQTMTMTIFSEEL